MNSYYGPTQREFVLEVTYADESKELFKCHACNSPESAFYKVLNHFRNFRQGKHIVTITSTVESQKMVDLW